MLMYHRFNIFKKLRQNGKNDKKFGFFSSTICKKDVLAISMRLELKILRFWLQNTIQMLKVTS